MKANHHTHTLFSDGHAEPEAYVRQAILNHFDILGFTEHSPLPFENSFSFRMEQRENYIAQIKALKGNYADKLHICLGMEMDYIPGMSEDFAGIRELFGLDYQLGAVHLVYAGDDKPLWFTDGPSHVTYDQGLYELFWGDIRAAVGAYFRQMNQMISTQKFEVIAHFDKIKMHNRGRYFQEDEAWYVDHLQETIHLIKEKNLIVEVNTRGIYKKRSDTTYPGPALLKIIRQLDIPVMINSDAHLPEELEGAFEAATALLKEAGIRETVYFDKGKWKFQALEA